MNELQEEIDAINFADGDELSMSIVVGWRTFLKILVPMLPILVLCAIPPAVIITMIPFDQIAARLNLDALRAVKMQMRIEQMITAPFEAIVVLTAMVAAVRALARNQLGTWADFSTAMRRLLPSIGTWAILVAIIIGSVIPMVILVAMASEISKALSVILSTVTIAALLTFGIAMLVKLVFVGQSVVVGGTFGIESCRESMRLVKGKWLLTLGILIVVVLCGVLLQMPTFVAGICEGMLLNVTDNFAVLAIADAFTIALGFVGGLFGTSALTVLYLMRRNRLVQQAAEAPFVDPPFGDDEVHPSDFRQ